MMERWRIVEGMEPRISGRFLETVSIILPSIPSTPSILSTLF